MNADGYPDFFQKMSSLGLSPAEGAARLATDKVQVLFYQLHEGGEGDDFSTGAEWGYIIRGRVDVTIDGETTTYEAGDTYLIPGGVPNHKKNHPGIIGIDVFEQVDRFTAASA